MAKEAVENENIAVRTNQFVRDVWVEMLKVNWTSRDQLWQATKVVIVGTAVMALFLGGIDYLFAAMLKLFLKN